MCTQILFSGFLIYFKIKAAYATILLNKHKIFFNVYFSLCLFYLFICSFRNWQEYSENRSSGSSNWTDVSGGRPVQSDPNTLHHRKSRTENCNSNKVAVPDPRLVRSDPNPYYHNDNPTASQPWAHWFHL